MRRKTQSRNAAPVAPPAPVQSGRTVIPRKETFTISEVAALWASAVGGTSGTAKKRLYRAIQRGEIEARRHISSLRIPYGEVVRIIRGEEIEYA